MQADFATSILNAVPMPTLLIGSDGRIQAMNQRATDVLGRQGIGRSYVTTLRQPQILDCVEAVLQGGRPGVARFMHTSAIREVVYRVTVAPVLDTGGQGAMVSLEDITDLEHAGQMRRDFVANVSHELKTPLTALLGFIETLRGAARDDPVARDRFLTIMEREAERMNRLVSDLLSLSRVESTARQRPQEPVDIGGLVASVLDGLRPMAEMAEVALEIEGELPGVTVPGDADQLQQVLINLVENAVKYGGSGGRVTLRLSRIAHEGAIRGPAVQIDVIDYGAGFEQLHVPRLTERFYRIDTHRSRAQGGTGLGLAISKHIVNRHRGRLKISTEQGVGSTFSVVLPISA